MSDLQDILREDLTEDEQRVVIEHIWGLVLSGEGISKTDLSRSKTLGKSKSLLEFLDLVRVSIENYESRAGVTEDKRVVFTEEEPDVEAAHEVITFSLIERRPGAFSQGPPREGRVKNRGPVVREIANDPEHPGYQQAVFGQWYDNVVRFTCWARTNKAANERAEWFENLMDEYLWFFRLQGVSRVLFEERQADIVFDASGNRWYGRPLDYFVRTEKLRVYSQKTLEEVLIRIGVTDR